MKILKDLATAALVLTGITVGARSRTETIKVSGNCGMCAANITKAALQSGAEKAHWDKETKVLTVTYNESETSNEAIQKLVADAGYDTELYIGNEMAYNALHSCCKYTGKRKEFKEVAY